MSAVTPRLASGIVVFRRAPALEVYWVKRGERVPYMPGFHAFPGGAVDKADAATPVANAPAGEPVSAIVAAIRECFEETGVLFARGAERVDAHTRETWRVKLTARRKEERASFAEFLAATGVEPDASRFRAIGHWITPPFSPMRFDSRFFLAEFPAGEQATVIPGELASGEWTRPAAAVERWQGAEALVAPPVLHILRACAASDDPQRWPAAATAIPEASGGEVRRIEMRAGVVLVPVRTPTLPPATHTNCYVVGGARPIVVDPGADDEREQRALEDVLAALSREGRKPQRIAITHAHHDHFGGVERLRTHLGVPVVAHADARDALASAGVRVDESVGEAGARWDTGEPVSALHTPGHARGHLAFVHEPSQSLLSGDLILGMGTTVIDPPDGDMESYMRSLEKLAAMPLRALFPGHGPVLASTLDKIREYRAHRDEREQQVLGAMKGGADSPEAIVRIVYTDVPAELHPFAARSVLAHLEWLARRGAVSHAAGKWTLT